MHRRVGVAVIEEREQYGGIFAPVPTEGLRLPVYTWGPKTHGRARTDHLFQCPVSAIPPVVWELMMLWRDCRLMHVSLPATPLWRRAYVTLEEEMIAAERRRGDGHQVALLGAAFQALARK